MNFKLKRRYSWLAVLPFALAAVLAMPSCDRPDTCEGSTLCDNGYLILISNCTCFCENEWEGKQCNICNLTSEDCPPNSFANGELCRCECDPGWCGGDCDIPVLDCENGGDWNEFTCTCDCPPGWAGEVCDSII